MLVSTVAADVVTAVVDDVVGGLNRNDNKGGTPRCKASSPVSVKVVEQCEQRTCGRSGQEIRCTSYIRVIRPSCVVTCYTSKRICWYMET